MKKILALLLAAAMLLSLVPALAEGADIRINLPASIAAYFSQSKFNKSVIEGDCYVKLDTPDGKSLAYVIVTRSDIHTLYGFQYNGSEWVCKMRNDAVMPYAVGNPTIFGDSDALIIKLYSATSNMAPYEVTFSYKSGNFVATHVNNPETKTFADISSDHITYYNNQGERIGAVYGTITRTLNYYSFSTFPKTYNAAKNKLTIAPDIPYNSELTAQNIRFQNGQKYPVYSGPSTAYLRPANGKAVVSTNDWIQVFGYENGYILIQYALNSNQMRFGYIEASSLPKNASVPPLALEFGDAVLLQSTNLTDDPLLSQSVLMTLSANQQVKWLATMGSWVYVEVDAGTPVRGFVPMSVIARAATPRAYADSYSDASYTANANVQIENGMLYATVTVTGNPNTETNTLIGYQLYANNQPIASSLSAGSGAQTFTFATPIASDTTVLGFCPVYTNGERSDEAIVIALY